MGAVVDLSVCLDPKNAWLSRRAHQDEGAGVAYIRCVSVQTFSARSIPGMRFRVKRVLQGAL